jgi:hypothetical protein
MELLTLSVAKSMCHKDHLGSWAQDMHKLILGLKVRDGLDIAVDKCSVRETHSEMKNCSLVVFIVYLLRCPINPFH